METNFRRGGMKRLMEEAEACHAEAIHYSTSARIRVGADEDRKTKNFGLSEEWMIPVNSVGMYKVIADFGERVKLDRTAHVHTKYKIGPEGEASHNTLAIGQQVTNERGPVGPKSTGSSRHRTPVH